MTTAALGRYAGLALALAVVVWGAMSPATARADGDPGSDVLVYQSLFVTSSAGVSVAKQVQLNGLLGAGQAGGGTNPRRGHRAPLRPGCGG